MDPSSNLVPGIPPSDANVAGQTAGCRLHRPLAPAAPAAQLHQELYALFPRRASDQKSPNSRSL